MCGGGAAGGQVLEIEGDADIVRCTKVLSFLHFSHIPSLETCRSSRESRDAVQVPHVQI